MNASTAPQSSDPNRYRVILVEMCAKAGLTARQKAVWLAVFDGYTDAEIALDLCIPEALVVEVRAAAANKLQGHYFDPVKRVSPVTLLKCVRNQPEIERDPDSLTPSQDYSTRPKAFGEVASDLRTAEDAPLAVALGLACRITGHTYPRLTLRSSESGGKRTADECHAAEIRRLQELGARLVNG